jgi:hypothetical protein
LFNMFIERRMQLWKLWTLPWTAVRRQA